MPGNSNGSPPEHRYFLVDAFTSREDPKVKGNPAGVILASGPISDEILCNKAKTLGVPALAVICDLSLFSSIGPEADTPLGITWINPLGGFIPLCGHATMAASLVLFKLFPTLPKVTLQSRLGVTLIVTKTEHGAELGFPALLRWTEPKLEPSEKVYKVLADALNIQSQDIVRVAECPPAGGSHKDILVELRDHVDIRALTVRPDILLQYGYRGTWLVGPGSDGFDMHTRAFFPISGMPEDMVCGHAHTMFAPYWATERSLSIQADGFVHLKSRQVSPSGGVLGLRWDGKWGEDGGFCYIAGEGQIHDKGRLYGL